MKEGWRGVQREKEEGKKAKKVRVKAAKESFRPRQGQARWMENIPSTHTLVSTPACKFLNFRLLSPRGITLLPY